MISPPNIDHKLFFFTKDRKKLTIEQLSSNLNKIITYMYKDSLLSDQNDLQHISCEQRKHQVKLKQTELVANFKNSVQGKKNGNCNC